LQSTNNEQEIEALCAKVCRSTVSCGFE